MIDEKLYRLWTETVTAYVTWKEKLAEIRQVCIWITETQWSVVSEEDYEVITRLVLVVVSDWVLEWIYTVSQKNDTDVAHYNFNAHQPILVIFGRDVDERVCYQMLICYPTSPN